MEIRFGRKQIVGRGGGLVVLALAVTLALVDFVALRGEVVDVTSVHLSSATPALLRMDRVGEEHTIEISTRRRSGGESRGRSIRYRLEDPDGRVLVEDSEMISRKKRFLRFEPERPGEYRLFLEAPGLLGASSGSARVAVTVGDRRILGRLLPF